MVKKQFTIDAKTLLTLGRDSIKDNTTAISELVKNSYDADATRVEIEIWANQLFTHIKITDNGCGMSKEDVEKRWLRIGFSAKILEKISKRNRRKTGEKGIGRLSADRLGSMLTLITKSANGSPYGLRVDWNKFSVEGQDLAKIDVEELTNPQPKFLLNGESSATGTILNIEQLRQTWSETEIENLYNELAALMPPFNKVKDFEIFLKTNITNKYNGIISTPFHQVAEIEVQVDFNDKTQEIDYTIKNRATLNGKENLKHKINWSQLSQKIVKADRENLNEKLTCGPTSIKLLFYRRIESILEGTSLKLPDLKKFLDSNVGIRVYRDNIRVKPYGDINSAVGDWLGLGQRRTKNPEGVSQDNWKVGQNQLVGAVFISRDLNQTLIDSSGREGLKEDDAFKDLRALVLGSITLLESFRMDQAKKGQIQKEQVNPAIEMNEFKDKLKKLHGELKDIKTSIPATQAENLEVALSKVNDVLPRFDEAIKVVDELYNENRILGGLATIGISSAVFGHETQSSIDQFLLSVGNTIDYLENNPPNVKDALEEAITARDYANKTSAWGSFALSRVQKGKREKRKIDIKDVVENVIKQLTPAFKTVNIQIIQEIQSIETTLFAMDIETILVNMMTNAYTACMLEKRPRQIKVTLKKTKYVKRDGFELMIGDSGPGVAMKFKESIWEPLFTTKKNEEGREIGTGLGLAIVQSIINEVKGIRFVEQDPILKGALFRIWIPFN